MARSRSRQVRALGCASTRPAALVDDEAETNIRLATNTYDLGRPTIHRGRINSAADGQLWSRDDIARGPRRLRWHFRKL